MNNTLFNVSSVQEAQRLLAAGHSLDATDREGNTPLHVNENPDVLELFLSKVSIPLLNSYGKHPVLCHTRYECLKLFRREDYDRVDKWGNTALHLNKFEDARSMALFLPRHANTENKLGFTPVFTHTTLGDIRLLQSHGAMLHHATDFGQTLPMFLLHNNAEPDVISYVLKQVKNHASKDGNGCNLFHFVRRREHVQLLMGIIPELLNKRNNNCNTALGVAVNDEVMAALIQAGGIR